MKKLLFLLIIPLFFSCKECEELEKTTHKLKKRVEKLEKELSEIQPQNRIDTWKGRMDSFISGDSNWQLQQAHEDGFCSDPTACNYNEEVGPEYINNDKCEYRITDCDTCSGETDGSGTVVDNDSDDDGVCDSWDSDNSGNL